MRKFLSILLFAISLVSVPLGVELASAEEPAAFDAWNESEFVFTGKLEIVQAGPVGQSFPPVYTHRLEFKVDQVMRGELKRGAKIATSHVARQEKRPTFPEDQICLVAASSVRGKMQIQHVEVASAEKLMDISMACSLPLGWKVIKGKPVSPWSSLGDQAWSENIDLSGNLVCSVTGRPALFNGTGVKFSVEKVPPAKEIKWTNPDGDGEYKITLTNTTDEPQEVKSLLTDGKNIQWNECIVILCQGKVYASPGAKGVAQQVKPVSLKPGESVSTVVNALKLDGPEWPRGGYRIEFQFCLGDASQTQSFYYMSRHHDPIRKSLSAKKTEK